MLCAILVLNLLVLSHAMQDVTISSHWDGGFQGRFTITPDHNIHGWCAHLVFDQAIDGIAIWKAKLVSKCGDQKFIVQNVSWDGDVKSGTSLDINFNGKTTGDINPRAVVFIFSGDKCSSCSATSSSGGGANTRM